MTPNPAEFMVKAYKQNIDCGMRVVEALVEGATKIRETQLEAATSAHAATVAAQKAIAAASDPAEIWKQYSAWMLSNAQQSAAYWQHLARAFAETNAEVLKCVGESAPVLPPIGATDSEAAKQVLAGLMDNAYKQWAHVARELYGASTRPSVPA